MATLTNPVNAQNIVDRFADYVTATANAGITYGINNRHFGDFVAANMPNATETPQNGVPPYSVPVIGFANAEPYATNASTGRGIGITGGNISGNPVTASTIYNTLVSEMNAYCRIRSIRTRLMVLGTGGNSGSRPTQGVVTDVTGVAYWADSWFNVTPSAPANAGVASGNAISAANLESFFDNLRTAYNGSRTSATRGSVVINVCHASCHSNCHSSRGRR